MGANILWGHFMVRGQFSGGQLCGGQLSSGAIARGQSSRGQLSGGQLSREQFSKGAIVLEPIGSHLQLVKS